MFRVTPRVVKVETSRRQQTLARQVDVAGFGLWTGVDVVYSFRPAAENSGVRFFRDDLPNSSPIPANVRNRIQKPRQTSLAVGDAQVDMVEHVLSALRAARVDNCDVVVDAPEAPGCDGSCAPFLKAFLDAGVVSQQAWRSAIKVMEPGVYYPDGATPDNARIEILPSLSEETFYEYNLHYDRPSVIPNQKATFNFSASPMEYLREIAPCRTFLTLEEANALRAMGVCQRVTAKDALVFAPEGIIDNELRFDNECARHKLLDMVGDFALAPVDWIGEFRAYKTGHQQNADLVASLFELCE